MRVSKALSSFVLFSLVSATTPALAAGYGPAGCGLGSMLIGKKPGFTQIFAATTNGSSASQTFGITSGTSNCVPMGKTKAFHQQREFMHHNLISLSQEAARGDGETLAAFASTMGCSQQGLTAVAKTMQAHHSDIFSEPGVDHILHKTHETLRTNAMTAQHCSDLI